MSVQEEAVIAALRTVNDPDLHRDLWSLNMIKDLKIADSGEVSLTVVLTTPACPMKALIESDVRTAVMRVAGVKKVSVTMTSNVTSTPRPLTLGQGIRNIIGVASGKGGVGKSTVAVNLACALSRSGARVGVLDADIYGPNVPIMLGLMGQQPEVVMGKDAAGADLEMIIPLESNGIKVISMGFLIADDQPVMWRGPMLNSALRQFFGQVLWGDLDYLIVDLPPGTGDVQISLIQLVKITGIVHVTTPQDVALQDVRKGIAMFAQQKVPLLGIIENMSFFACPHCGERSEIFSHGGGAKIAEKLGIPFLGEIPLSQNVREGGDTGKPIVLSAPDSPQAQQIIKAAEQLAAQVSMANFQQTNKEPAHAAH